MSTSSAFTPTVLTVASAATAGSGEINAILNPSASGSTSGWTATGTATVTRLASGGPLDPVIPTALSLAAGAASDYIKYDFVLPASLKNTKLKIEWSQAAPTTGEWKVELRTQAGVVYPLTTDSSGVTLIPAAAGKFTTTFQADNVQTLSLRFVRVTGSGSLTISNVIVGPGVGQTAPVVGPELDFTPGSFIQSPPASTLTVEYAKYVRVGEKLRVKIRYKPLVFNYAGSAQAANTVTLDRLIPTGLTIPSSFLSSRNGFGAAAAFTQGASHINGYAVGFIEYNTTTSGFRFLLATKDTSVLGDSCTALQWGTLGNIPAASTDYFFLDLEFEVPIAEWAGSGTVNLAQNDVEYAASTSGTWDAAATAGNTVYGPSGAPITGALTAARSKVVQFQSPIQPTDRVVLEYLVNGSWIESQVSNQPYINTSGLDYGAQVQPVSGTTNQVLVSFAQYRVGPSGTNWGTSTGALAWNGTVSQGAAWRVRKTSAGAAVGFGIVQPGVSSGLVSASGLPGRTDGGVVPAGYVGQTIRDTTSAAASLSSTTNFVDLHFYDVPAGVWLVYGGVGIDNAATNTGADVALSQNTGNTTTDHVTGYNVQQIRVAANNPSTAVCGPLLCNFVATTRVYLKGKAIGATTTSNSKSIWMVRIA